MAIQEVVSGGGSGNVSYAQKARTVALTAGLALAAVILLGLWLKKLDADKVVGLATFSFISIARSADLSPEGQRVVEVIDKITEANPTDPAVEKAIGVVSAATAPLTKKKADVGPASPKKVEEAVLQANAEEEEIPGDDLVVED